MGNIYLFIYFLAFLQYYFQKCEFHSVHETFYLTINTKFDMNLNVTKQVKLSCSLGVLLDVENKILQLALLTKKGLNFEIFKQLAHVLHIFPKNSTCFDLLNY